VELIVIAVIIAAVAVHLAGPETDAELLAFVRSCAAGQILISHAWYAYAGQAGQ